ncbi:MAG TPA: GYD domain-containing protein [Acidimicrobiia bacterium]|nr:GYD domain-containing protein [Acidimicrobiia bacterium]
MPKYLALFSYSDEAMAAMIENPADREPAVRAVLDSVGGRLESLYWMFGAHDGIAIVEGPDSVSMAGISAAIRSTGSIRSETHELFSTADIRRILDTAGRARTTFTEPGHPAT